MSDENTIERADLTSAQVEAYLQAHPEFFHQHLGLLEHLSIPHPSGNAVSLISKQLEIFRSKHHELENQLTALIEIAKENDSTLSQMHELTLALMEAQTIDDVKANLDKVFKDCFLITFLYCAKRNIVIKLDSSSLKASISSIIFLFTKSLIEPIEFRFVVKIFPMVKRVNALILLLKKLVN